MDNRRLRIGYFLRKFKFAKFALVALTIIISFFDQSRIAYAVPYGDGNYGANLYGEDFPASSPASAPICGDTAPKSAPVITLASGKSTTEIQLTFTQAADPVTSYALKYGPESQKYIYSSTNIGGHDTTTYTVTKLSPNSTYYFRLRAGNGCMPGEWSSEVSGKTLPRFSNKSLNIINTTVTPVPDLASESGTVTKETTTLKSGYDVSVTVVNTKNEPVSGAKVTIHSDPKEATTNKDGIAEFSRVEAGSHTLLIAYGNYSGEESIFLNGDVKAFKISVTVEEKKEVFSTPAIIIFAVLLITIILLGITLFLRKNTTNLVQN